MRLILIVSFIALVASKSAYKITYHKDPNYNVLTAMDKSSNVWYARIDPCLKTYDFTTFTCTSEGEESSSSEGELYTILSNGTLNLEINFKSIKTAEPALITTLLHEIELLRKPIVEHSMPSTRVIYSEAMELYTKHPNFESLTDYSPQIYTDNNAESNFMLWLDIQYNAKYMRLESIDMRVGDKFFYPKFKQVAPKRFRKHLSRAQTIDRPCVKLLSYLCQVGGPEFVEACAIYYVEF
jgi:hypothetical protein